MTAIPDEVSHKPGRLTKDEIAVIKDHSYRGYQMLKKVPFLSNSAEIVYAHQERYDGSGYPRGLKGDDIPLGARIFSVADAIVSGGRYREARSLNEARAEIARWSGTQFDPHIARILLDMPDTVWKKLQREPGQKSTDPA
jgi:HD-GYP domain-containing protein (c-di-GMP phosphodiesterase class II)